MLIRFNFKNYRSFTELHEEERKTHTGSTEEFTMIPGSMSTKKDHLIHEKGESFLRMAAIYGANASGKSNLIKAADFMKNTILRGNLELNTESYFKLFDEQGKQTCKDSPSYFEMEIWINGKHYSYGFETVLSQERFLSEWLVEISKSTEKILFYRDLINPANNEVHKFSSPSLNEKINGYFDDLCADDSQLFLSELNRNKAGFYDKFKEASIFQDVYLWFEKKLEIIFPMDFIPLREPLYTEESIQTIAKILGSMDTGITRATLTPVSENAFFSKVPENVRKQILRDLKKLIALQRKRTSLSGEDPRQMCMLLIRGPHLFSFIFYNAEGDIEYKKLCFFHEDRRALFDVEDESDGTLRLLDLMDILAGHEDKTYLVDELDRSLHPELIHKFVELFFQLRKTSRTQLVTTCHDQRLLDHSFLRRDEIWMIQKRKDGSSHLYSLEEFNIRNDQRIDKAYRENRYGGVPVFQALFPITDPDEILCHERTAQV